MLENFKTMGNVVNKVDKVDEQPTAKTKMQILLLLQPFYW